MQACMKRLQLRLDLCLAALALSSSWKINLMCFLLTFTLKTSNYTPSTQHIPERKAFCVISEI